jgi:hypothetical protein
VTLKEFLIKVGIPPALASKSVLGDLVNYEVSIWKMEPSDALVWRIDKVAINHEVKKIIIEVIR